MSEPDEMGYPPDPEPPCPHCGRPLARVRTTTYIGWTCVNCNAAGDPEEDHLEDPAALPAWDCPKCGQKNSGWVKQCGRCESDQHPDPADSRPCGCEEVEGLRSELLGARADAAKQFEERMALVELLGRIVKYAREDRASTPGVTRLARALAEAEKLLSGAATPEAPNPVPMQLSCPNCQLVHVDTLDRDTGIDWATRPHKTHKCLGCGQLWKPREYATVGVAAPTLGLTDYDVSDGYKYATTERPEPWRVGTRVPEHVYIGDRPLVTMPTAELAALVVRAVNRTALEPDHCDHCDARIDGDHAATSDVCWDCWQTAKAAALTPGQRRVLEACAAFPTEHLTGDAYPSSSNRNELSDLSLRWSQAVLALRAEEGGA